MRLSIPTTLLPSASKSSIVLAPIKPAAPVTKIGKLSLFDNKSPLEARKYKKYKKKIEEALKDIDLIYESRLSEDELVMDPNYIRERLNID